MITLLNSNSEMYGNKKIQKSGNQILSESAANKQTEQNQYNSNVSGPF